MEGLNYLCVCCKNIHCDKKQLQVKKQGSCKIIKCLNYIKDNTKITPYRKDKFGNE